MRNILQSTIAFINAVALLSSAMLPVSVAQERQRGVLARTETAFGLHTASFDTLAGTVTVNLPSDLEQGDTISGSVIAEPKGKTTEEQLKNRNGLSGYVVEVNTQKTHLGNESAIFKSAIPTAASTIPVVLRDRQGRELASAQVAVNKSGTSPEVEYQTPSIAQAGRPIEMKGKFDGAFQTSAVRIANTSVKVLAESPRKLVAQGVAQVGLSEIEVAEQGQTVAKGTFVNVGVRLSAGKLNLLKGEQTNLTLTLLGLDNLQTPMSLQVDNRTPGVVRMTGGDNQLLAINPKEVQGNSFTITRVLTGVEPGGFVINATVAATQNDSRTGVDTTRRHRPNEANPRVTPCDRLVGRLQQAAEDINFEIALDDSNPQPGQVFTARVGSASPEISIGRDTLFIPEAGGSSLYAHLEVYWQVLSEGGTDLGADRLATPDGPQSLWSNNIRLKLAPIRVVEAGYSPIPTSPVTLHAYVRLKGSCGGNTTGVTRGEETVVSSDEIRVPPREIQLPALQIATLLALFRNPNAATSLFSELTWGLIEGAALIVLRPGLRVGPLEGNTLLGTVDPGADLTRAPELVIQYLEGLNAKMVDLSTTFPTNQLVQQLNSYGDSVAEMKGALQRLAGYTNSSHISFRATNELRQLNFPFIHGSHILNNVNVEDEVSSLIFAGPPGRTLEIFNAPNFEEGEGVLSIALEDYPTQPVVSAVIPNLNVFTRSWARRFPEGERMTGGATVRVLHPPAGNLLRPLVGNFEDQISSLRLR